MRGRIYDRVALPPACWEAADMLDALAARDVGHVFRTTQRLTGASQTQIGMSTGLSQAQVSEIMGRKRQVTTIDVLARIVTGLGIPDPARTVLLLGDRGYADTFAERAALPPPAPEPPPPAGAGPSSFADVTAIYATRSEFMSRMPPHSLLDSARVVRAAGLSLNLICHHYADNNMVELLTRGTRLQCLFLDPAGAAIRAREVEEAYEPGHLSALTEMNITNLLRRVRDRLDPEVRDNLTIGVYDETVRYNILLLDDSLCVAQPYLPDLRGVDSPTLVMRRAEGPGLYSTFEAVYDRLWERARLL